MSTIVVHAFISLDGVVQGGGGPDEDREGGFGWKNSHLLGPDVPTAVKGLRAAPGGEIQVWGSTRLIFEDGFPVSRFTLAGSRGLKSGVVVNNYRRRSAS